jgi:hypothetical protein
MQMDVKKALADWKKAKPLLLTKTGVSEELRTLLVIDPATPIEFKSVVRQFEKVKANLDAIANSPRLKSEKAARQCLDAITLKISAHVDWLTGRQTGLNTAMGTVRSQLNEMARDGDKFFQLYQEDKLRIQDATAFEGGLATRATTISNACLKAGINQNWSNEFNTFSVNQRNLLHTQIIPAVRVLARGVNGGPKTLPGLATPMTSLHDSTRKAPEHLDKPVLFSY